MNYSEPKDFTRRKREDYLASLFSFAEKDHPELHTGNQIIDELGYPLTLLTHENPTVEKTLLSHEDDFDLYRYTFLFLNEIRFTGIYFKKHHTNLLTVMQHGYVGTPEVMSNIYPDRNSYNYNDITKRLLMLNSSVFCPQTLMWSIEAYGVSYDRVALDETLRKHHSSLFAVEVYALKEVIHYFRKEYDRVNMFGMSYGGMYTYYVGEVSDEVHHYFVSSYMISNLRFPESVFATPLKEVVLHAIKKPNFYVSLGTKDPIQVVDQIKEILKEADMSRINFFDGDHEINKSDDYLKTVI